MISAIFSVRQNAVNQIEGYFYEDILRLPRVGDVVRLQWRETSDSDEKLRWVTGFAAVEKISHRNIIDCEWVAG